MGNTGGLGAGMGAALATCVSGASLLNGFMRDQKDPSGLAPAGVGALIILFCSAAALSIAFCNSVEATGTGFAGIAACTGSAWGAGTGAGAALAASAGAAGFGASADWGVMRFMAAIFSGSRAGAADTVAGAVTGATAGAAWPRTEGGMETGIAGTGRSPLGAACATCSLAGCKVGAMAVSTT